MKQWRLWLVVLGLCGSGAVFAQTYPVKPVRIVTVAPGSANDIVARLIAQEIRAGLGQPVVVDNRGTVAAELVARAPADGYTLLLYGSAVWLSPFIRASTPYDPVKDFAPVTLVASSPNVVVVHPSLPVKSARELIALAKARPGEINYAAGSLGAAPHLAAELFKAMGKLNIVRVAYKGTGGSLIGILSGEVGLMFPTAGSVTPYIKSGKLRALAVTPSKRSALLPDLPTMAEAGVPGYNVQGWNGLVGPAGLPRPVVDRLNRETVAVLRRDAVRQRLLELGAEPVGNTPEQFGAHMRAERELWGKLITKIGLKLD